MDNSRDAGSQESAQTPSALADHPLVGRDAELECLAGSLEQARNGASRAIAVTGRAGTGKSELVGRLREMAPDFSLLEVHGIEDESEIAFSGLFELLGPVLELRSTLPDPQREALEGALALGPTTRSDRFAVSAATLGMLARAAEDAPLLVVVEDLQWVDDASRAAILFALRRVAADGIAAVLTRREGTDSGPDLRGFDEIVLPPLGDRDAAALLEVASEGPVQPDVAEAIIEEAAGNPLVIVQAARLLSAEQLGGHEPLHGPLPISQAMTRSLDRRAASVGGEALLALTLVTAAGAGPSIAVLERALSVIGLDTSALELAEATGFVRIDDGGVEFVDPLMRSAIYQRASARDRRAAHGALASALEGDGDVERRAWHLADAAVGTDESAATALADAAAHAAARGGHAAAAGAYERAAALTPEPGSRAARLVDAARETNLAGRPHKATALVEAALECDDGTVRADAVHIRGRMRAWSAPIAEIHEALVSEGELVAPHDPARAARMLADAALPLVRAGDVETGLATARRAAELAVSAGADAGSAELVFALSLIVSGRAVEAEPLIDRWTKKLSSEGPSLDAVEPWHAVPRALVWIERYDDARGLLESFVELGRRCAPGALPFSLGTLAELEFRTGRFATSRATAAEGATLARDMGQPIGAAFCLASLARVAAATGREDECRAAAEEAMRIGERLGGDTPIRTLGAPALGLLRLAQGKPLAAAEELAPVARASEARGLREPSMVQYRPNLVEALVRLDRLEEARRALAELRSQAQATGRTWAKACAARCQGLMAEDPEEFGEHFAEALDWHSLTTTPLERARTLLCLGERLRRAKRRAEAREQLRAALAEFERMGATPWADLARRELGASGERARRRSDPPSDELTPQELQVALSVASGATNKEAGAELFLSAKTIEAHLGRVYRKLGIRSRTELAAIVNRGELPPA